MWGAWCNVVFNLSYAVFELMEWADAQGRLKELVEKALEQNPSNPELKKYADSFVKPTSVTAPVGQQVAIAVEPDESVPSSVEPAQLMLKLDLMNEDEVDCLIDAFLRLDP